MFIAGTNLSNQELDVERNTYGPAGVEVHGDRDKTVIEKEKRTPDGDRDKTVIINKDRDGDRDKTVIHHD